MGANDMFANNFCLHINWSYVLLMKRSKVIGLCQGNNGNYSDLLIHVYEKWLDQKTNATGKIIE